MSLRTQQNIVRVRRQYVWSAVGMLTLMVACVVGWTAYQTAQLLQNGEQGAMLAAVDVPHSHEPTRQVRLHEEPVSTEHLLRVDADWLQDAAIPTQLAGPGHVDEAMQVTLAKPDVQHAAAAVEIPTFAGRPIRPVKTMRMRVTAYSPDARSCGKWADGITASGASVWTNGMKLVAADTRLLPFGSIVTIPGYDGGKPVPVLDRGGKIKGRRLDVLYPTHNIARQWGVQHLEVTVWEYAD